MLESSVTKYDISMNFINITVTAESRNLRYKILFPCTDCKRNFSTPWVPVWNYTTAKNTTADICDKC
jgi:ribosomal protein L33